MNSSLSLSLSSLLTFAALVLLPVNADAAPDLCDELALNTAGAPYTDTTGVGISRWCEPRTDPPAWAAPVCCAITDEANCTPATSRGECRTGMKFWCDYGEQIGDGVACYQPGPGACESGFCSEIENPNGMTVFHDHIWLCCYDLGNDVSCAHAGVTGNTGSPEGECGGFFVICNWGASNADGTVDCYG